MRFGTLNGNLEGFWVVAHDSGELASDTNTYEITGLDGDADIEYQLIVRYIQPGAVNLLLNFNNDTGANYGKQFIFGRDTTAQSIRFTGQGEIRITQAVSGSSGDIAFSNSHIFAKSGKERTLINMNCADVSGTTIINVEKSSSVWNNTADNLTSMQFSQSTGDIKAGSRFILLKKVHATTGMKLGAARPNKLENAWERIYAKTLTSAVPDIDIKDLKGDTDCVYRLIVRPISGTATSWTGNLTFNGDNAGTTYGIQRLRGTDTTADAGRSVGINIINPGRCTGLGELNHIEYLIYAKSGYERTVLCTSAIEISATTITRLSLFGGVWSNTTDEVISIQLGSSSVADAYGVGSSIELYRLNL